MELDEGQRYPLLVMLHGAGGTAAVLQRWTGMDTVATRAGYVTVFPDGLDNSWAVGCGGCTSAGAQGVDDIRFVQTLVRHLADALPVDTSRVFLAGHSLGAQLVHDFACEATLVPAGIAAVSGLWLRRTAVGCRPRRGFPVLMIHGDRDRILPWEGPRESIGALPMPGAFERWTELMECTGVPQVVEHPDAVGDGTRVETTAQGGCRDGGSVVLHRIRGAGHGWPGAVRSFEGLGPATGNLDGVREILDFFRPYARLPSP
jgi:polyhydroxybutyrate depolymerase